MDISQNKPVEAVIPTQQHYTKNLTPQHGEHPAAEVQPTAEQQPTPRSELTPQATGSAVVVPQPVVTQQVGASTSVQSHATTVHTDSTTARQMHAASLMTLAADDVELIEKPWVENSEKNIAEHKDDPYIEDELQHDTSRVYLKKRFNLDVS